uniref:Transmembrane protein 256 n=1 Tax=Ascaris suum TaxID=6253 RepID=F1L7C6_ASCSU
MYRICWCRHIQTKGATEKKMLLRKRKATESTFTTLCCIYRALRQYAINDERRLRAFETGNRYHLLHSVALLGSARARFPLLTASLFLAGIVIFSSTCYHYSITGEETFRRYTPVGGVLFIIAWLSFVF